MGAMGRVPGLWHGWAAEPAHCGLAPAPDDPRGPYAARPSSGADADDGVFEGEL